MTNNLMTTNDSSIPNFDAGVSSGVSDDRLLPAIAQDATSGRVLMLAWMNREAWEENTANRSSGLLQSLAWETMAERRNQWPSTNRATDASRLRRRHDPVARRANRAGVSRRATQAAFFRDVRSDGELKFVKRGWSIRLTCTGRRVGARSWSAGMQHPARERDC